MVLITSDSQVGVIQEGYDILRLGKVGVIDLESNVPNNPGINLKNRDLLQHWIISKNRITYDEHKNKYIKVKFKWTYHETNKLKLP